MRSLIALTILAHLLPTVVHGAPANAARSSSNSVGKILAICTTAIQRNTVQIRGDGNDVRVTVTKQGQVIANMPARRLVKGSLQATNLEVQYTGMNGFVNLSCTADPAGLIRINGATDYLACTAGSDVRAVATCNYRWSNAR